MSEWPFGTGTHYPSIRSWCIRCQESCYDPTTSGFGYDALCLCCREPLYVLRIAELEYDLAESQMHVRELEANWAASQAELAKFRECELLGDDFPNEFGCFNLDYLGPSHRHTVYHKEEE